MFVSCRNRTLDNFGWHTHLQIIRRSKYKNIDRRHSLGRSNTTVKKKGSSPESASKENSNKGLSVCQDKGGNQEDGSTPTTIVNSTDAPATIVNSTDALATVADIKEKTEVITGKSTVSNSGMGISTAAPSKSDTPKPDFRREKDKFDYRRDRERRRRGTNVASSQE